MGVLFSDVVAALNPDHLGHNVKISIDDNGVRWLCDCGATGVLKDNDIGDVLRANKVPTF